MHVDRYVLDVLWGENIAMGSLLLHCRVKCHLGAKLKLKIIESVLGLNFFISERLRDSIISNGVSPRGKPFKNDPRLSQTERQKSRASIFSLAAADWREI